MHYEYPVKRNDNYDKRSWFKKTVFRSLQTEMT